MQDTLKAAPYYLLNANTSLADILLLNGTSVKQNGDTVQGTFNSKNTSNMALVTLRVSVC